MNNSSSAAPVSKKTINFSAATFINDVAHFRNVVRQSIPHGVVAKVLLFEPDVYAFLTRLIALGLEQHTVVLPPNDQLGTLNDLAEHVDYCCGAVSVSGKTSLDEQVVTVQVQQTENTSFAWPTDGNIVFFTSGSSGKPKAIVKDWPLINNELATLASLFKIQADSVFISTVSHQHIYGLLFRALLPLKLQCQVTNTIEYPEELAYLIKQHQQVILVSSPAFLSRLKQDNVITDVANRLSYVFSSGGLLAMQDALTLHHQLGIAVTQVYGSTETGGIAYRQQSASSDDLWQFFPGVSCQIEPQSCRLILNSPFIHQQQMPLDDTGQIIDGRLKLLGRIDRTIKLEEKRVNLTQMELCCKNHEWVTDIKLLVLEGKRTVLAAVVQLNAKGWQHLQQEGARQVSQQLKIHLQQHFELVTIPRKWRYLTELPFNAQGKLPVKELEKLFV